MNWDAIGAIGEIAGAVAVIVTLGYVAIQIRQNTHSVITSVYESGMAGFNEVVRFAAGDAELSSILRRGCIDATSLDEEELFRFTLLVRHYTNHVYKLFRLYERGVFPESEWQNTVVDAVQLFSMPGMAEFKANNRYYADLWAAMDLIAAKDFSSFKFTKGSSSESD